MSWTKLESNWVDTVTSALKFLAGELIGNLNKFLDKVYDRVILD